MMLRQLPPGSRMEIAEYGDASRWSRDHYMLADLWDAIQQLTYSVVRSSGRRAAAPTPYPRPELDRAKFLESRLQRWRDRHQEG